MVFWLGINLFFDGVFGFFGVFFRDFGVFDGVLFEFSFEELWSGVDEVVLEEWCFVDFFCYWGVGFLLIGVLSCKRLFIFVWKLNCDMFFLKIVE